MGSGITFTGVLTIVLLVLKVTGYLNVSWWIVFLPMYGIFVLVVVIFIAAILWEMCKDIFKDFKKRL